MDIATSLKWLLEVIDSKLDSLILKDGVTKPDTMRKVSKVKRVFLISQCDSDQLAKLQLLANLLEQAAQKNEQLDQAVISVFLFNPPQPEIYSRCPNYTSELSSNGYPSRQHIQTKSKHQVANYVDGQLDGKFDSVNTSSSGNTCVRLPNSSTDFSSSGCDDSSDRAHQVPQHNPHRKCVDQSTLCAQQLVDLLQDNPCSIVLHVIPAIRRGYPYKRSLLLQQVDPENVRGLTIYLCYKSYHGTTLNFWNNQDPDMCTKVIKPADVEKVWASVDGSDGLAFLDLIVPGTRNGDKRRTKRTDAATTSCFGDQPHRDNAKGEAFRIEGKQAISSGNDSIKENELKTPKDRDDIIPCSDFQTSKHSRNIRKADMAEFIEKTTIQKVSSNSLLQSPNKLTRAPSQEYKHGSSEDFTECFAHSAGEYGDDVSYNVYSGTTLDTDTLFLDSPRTPQPKTPQLEWIQTSIGTQNNSRAYFDYFSDGYWNMVRQRRSESYHQLDTTEDLRLSASSKLSAGHQSIEDEISNVEVSTPAAVCHGIDAKQHNGPDCVDLKQLRGVKHVSKVAMGLESPGQSKRTLRTLLDDSFIKYRVGCGTATGVVCGTDEAQAMESGFKIRNKTVLNLISAFGD